MAEGIVQATPPPEQSYSSEGLSAPTLNISNLARAKTSLQLTPQEENLYYHHLENLAGSGKVMHDNGDISTIYSITEGINGKYYTLPSVYGGKILDRNAAVDRAIASGLDKFPSYKTPEEAMSRYQQMHHHMQQDVKNWYVEQGTYGEPSRGDKR